MAKQKQFNLLDVAVISRSRISKFSDTKQYVATADIDFNQIVGGEQVTYDGRPSRADLIMSRDDVLFAKMKKTVKVLAGSPAVEDKIFSTGFYILTPKKNISKKYLYFFLISSDFNYQKDLYSSGATMVAIGNEGLKRIKISLPVDDKSNPDIKEQEHVVALLEEAEELKNKRSEADQKMTTVIPALFSKMFGDPGSNPMGWDMGSLSDLGTLDRGKSQNRPRTAAELFGGSYPFIQTGDITNAGWRISKYHQTYSEQGLKQSKLWPKETLCITIAANIARTAILNFDACFPDSVVGFIPDEKSNADFVQGLFIFLQRRLEEMAPRAAQLNINLEILRNLKVIKPPKELQDEFAKRVKEILAFGEKQEKSTANINRLFSSILSRAFTTAI